MMVNHWGRGQLLESIIICTGDERRGRSDEDGVSGDGGDSGEGDNDHGGC